MKVTNYVITATLMVACVQANAGFETYPICTNDAYQVSIGISGNTVAWLDNRNGNWDVYGKRPLTGTESPVFANAANQWSVLAVDEDRVVYEDDRNGVTSIYTYDFLSQSESPVCDGPHYAGNPGVCGNIAVWIDKRDLKCDIYGYDLSTHTEFPICTHAADKRAAAVSGDIVVWTDYRSGNKWEIYGYDVPGCSEFLIYSPSTLLVEQDYLDISGTTVVWMDHSKGISDLDIYGYDFSSGTVLPICTASGEQRYPEISGNTVVWMDHRNGNWDIYGYDMLKGDEFPICTKPGAQESPDISGSTVVWEDWLDPINGPDVYGATIPEPATLSLLALGGAALAGVRRRRNRKHERASR